MQRSDNAIADWVGLCPAITVCNAMYVVCHNEVVLSVRLLCLYYIYSVYLRKGTGHVGCKGCGNTWTVYHPG